MYSFKNMYNHINITYLNISFISYIHILLVIPKVLIDCKGMVQLATDIPNLSFRELRCRMLNTT